MTRVMLYPDEQTKCANCGSRIRYVEVRYVDGLLGGAWQHIHSMSVFCTVSDDDRARP